MCLVVMFVIRRTELMRILCFLHLTELSGSSRLLCLQYRDFFQAEGLKITFAPASGVWAQKHILDYGRYSRSRVVQSLFSRIYWHGIVLPLRVFSLLKLPFYDAMWIERGLMSQHTNPWLETVVKKLKIPMVYSFDDALYAADDPELLVRRLQMANAVFTGSTSNIEFVRQHNSAVYRISGAVDVVRRYKMKENYDKDGPVIIGWIGSPLNDQHINMLLNVFRLLSQKYNIVIRIVNAYQVFYPEENLPFEFEKWSLETEAAAVRNFDIGIMPIPDTPYERGREGYKIKQYMACGVPTVCSAVGMNNELVDHGVNGYLATTEEEWEKALSTLIEDASLRERFGRESRQYVERTYSVEAVGRKMIQAFSNICNAAKESSQ